MADQATEPLSLEGKMVAILPAEKAAEVAARLRQAGGRVMELTNPDAVVIPTEQSGMVGAIKTAAAAFGDELRVFEAIRNALDRGQVVLIVEDGGPAAAELLAEAGAETVWDFSEWTFKKVGGEEPEGSEGQA